MGGRMHLPGGIRKSRGTGAKNTGPGAGGGSGGGGGGGSACRHGGVSERWPYLHRRSTLLQDGTRRLLSAPVDTRHTFRTTRWPA
eukprot:366348-Chlamydomonas_euryale.AAC.8